MGRQIKQLSPQVIRAGGGGRDNSGRVHSVLALGRLLLGRLTRGALLESG